jgi:hypothetical protein
MTLSIFLLSKQIAKAFVIAHESLNTATNGYPKKHNHA